MHTALPFLVPALLDEADLSLGEFRVLAHLFRRAGIKDHCWPSMQSIARACGLSKTSVVKYLASLERRGAIRRTKREDETNHYKLASLEEWLSGTKSVPVKKMNRSNILTGGGTNSVPKGDTDKENHLAPTSVAKEVLKSESRKRLPTPAKTTDPRFTEFRNAYFSAYAERIGGKYAPSEGDFGQLQNLLKRDASLTCDEFIEIFHEARDALVDQRYAFHCRKAGSLMAFCPAFNDVRAELAAFAARKDTPTRDYTPRVRLY